MGAPVNYRQRALLAGVLVTLTGISTGTQAGLLSLAQYPLFLTSAVTPNVLVIYDNSQSMDGTMAGKLIAGSDPSTRGNVARSIIRNTIGSYRTQFNWGLETFGLQGSPALYNTYAYYLGDSNTMVFTNDCANGVSASNGGLSCIPNPQPNNGYSYITYGKSGDDADVNDVLYIGGYYGPQLWGVGVNNSTSYKVFQNHNAVTTWNTSDFSSSLGTWGFTPTDAGFLPTTPPYPRELWVYRAWGYDNDITGYGTIVEPAQPDSSTHYNTLMAKLAPETDTNSGEIKNAAVFTPLTGSFITANNYFTGSSSPISLSCQRNFVLLATDGNPTGRTDGSMYSYPSQTTSTYNSSTGTWTFSQAANDVFSQITGLRSVTYGGNSYDIQTYVVGLGDTVANPASAAALNQFASLGGTSQAYFATDTNSLSNAFQSIAADIASRTAAASSVSLNTGQISSGTAVYQARFNSGSWSGQLLSIPVLAQGALGTPSWDAGQIINGQNWDTGRQIITYKPSETLGNRGIPFRWPANPSAPTATEMDTTQSTALNTSNTGTQDGYGALRLQYLRGNTANEQAQCSSCTPSFRNRPTSRLGDIIDSSPNYVAAPSFNYPDSMEAAPYSQFFATYQNRTPMVYVGANDGMLHAFNASTGQEVFAYVPNAVYPNLSLLTSPNYTHHEYVDGTPTTGDVFYNGAWHTILVGGLQAGGQGIYTLDITDPSQFSEANATKIARWEFTDANDADLGYTFGQPLIVKTNDGRWSIILANGYNNAFPDAHTSATGHAVLFVLDAETGAVKAKIDTDTGSTSTPDGLSSPIAVDTNGDGTADVVYAGDLAGNLWKFDLSATAAGSWKVAYGNVAHPQPLFSTGGQPITVRPDVTKFPQGGYMVVFGTGRYIDTSDNGTTNPQTFYGIWDNGAALTGLSSLQQQTVVGTATGSDGNTYRITTHAVGPATLDQAVPGDNAIPLQSPPSPSYYGNKQGWYINLPTSGERVVMNPDIRNGRVVFNTLIPNTDACSYGGTGWVMELDVNTGNRLDTVTFDTNNDNALTVAQDLLSYGSEGLENASGRQISSIPAEAGFLGQPTAPGQPTKEYKFLNTTSGQVQKVLETGGKNNQGRVSWEQLE